MKYLLYPFKKGSFWIIFAISSLIVILFPVVKGRIVSNYLNRSWDYMDWKFLLSVRPDESIIVKWLIFEMQFASLANYLGHLIFFGNDEIETSDSADNLVIPENQE